MTSQKSSPANSRRAFSPFMYTFSRAFAENFIFPLLNMLGIAAFTVITLVAEAIPNIQMMAAADKKTLPELYRYLILPGDEFFSYFLMLVVCLCSALTGVFLFRFMTAKKTVNVFYSLGIKRRSLFLAKYAAGAIMLAASVVIPMLLCAAINIHYFGSSPELWQAIGYYMLSLYLLAMICMTVTAAVFSAVGTVLEGTFFSAVILLLPTIFIYCLQFLMSTLLWGSSYASRQVYWGDYQELGDSLIQQSTPYNPIFFLQKGLGKLGAYEVGTTLAKEDVTAAFMELLPWLAACAVCLGIALLVFQRRKTEISGFIGKNKILNFLVELTLGFGASTAALYFLYDRINHILAFAIALLLYFLAYLVIEIILTRSAKMLLKGLWKLPIHLAIPIAVYAILTTGLFGYTSRIPEANDIKEVYVDADYSFEIYGEKYFNGGVGTGAFSANTDNNYLAGALTTERDIEFARWLHQTLIDAKDAEQTVDKPLCIVYLLEDGSMVKRYYTYSTSEALEKSLALYETDWSRETMREVISSNPTQQLMMDDEANPQAEHPDRQAAYGYETGTVLLIDAITREYSTLELTPEQHTALKQAIIDDVTAQTAQQRFHPEQPNQYYLRFFGSADYEPDSYGLSNLTSAYPLTESMTHTLAFLQDNGMIPAEGNTLPDPSDISAVPIADVYQQLGESVYSSSGDDNASRLFVNGFEQLDSASTVPYNPFDSSANLTQEQFNTIRNHLYPFYYTGNTGYGVELKIDDYIVTLFLPEQYATPEIKALFGA